MKTDLNRFLQSVDQVEEKEVEWLVPHWIPKGGITLLVGDGGVGKTSIWCYLLARISANYSTMLDDDAYIRSERPGVVATLDLKNNLLYEKGPNRTCLYFSKEDSTAKRLKKTLDRYDAYMPEICTVDIEHIAGLHFCSPDLEKMVESRRPAVCVFDPIQAFFPPGASMSSRQHTRRALNHLVELSMQYNLAFLLVCHTNKKRTDDWRQRLTGSADLADIARSVIFTSYTEIMSDHRIRYLSNEKNSYAPLQSTVLYTMEAGGVIRFAGMSDRRFADFACDPPFASSAARQRSMKDLCVDAILSLLQERKEIPVQELTDLLSAEDFSPKVINTAKAELVARGQALRERRSVPKPDGTGTSVQWFIRLPDVPASLDAERMQPSGLSESSGSFSQGVPENG